MSLGKLDIAAATLIAVSALAAPAFADEMESPFSVAAGIRGAAERNTSAGTTLIATNGWRASLFVSSLATRQAFESDAARLKSTSFVNARLSRNLSRRTRVSLEVFNVFDHRAGNVDYFSTTRAWSRPGAGESFLFNPAEPRGFLVKVRTTF